ncbi:MAG: hypothetical protein KDB00_29145 [Planctomycetales bacterium]|nr:hypothetical protein [Planctomycetales bacterium]
MSKKIAWTVIGIVTLSAIGWFCLSTEPDTNENQKTQRSSTTDSRSSSVSEATSLVSSRPVIERNDGYLGSDSCKECHEDYYQSWHTSYHRTMTQPVTSETAPAAIRGGSVTVKGQTYTFSQRDDDFFVELNDPIANDRRMTRRLVLMTGSHHMHVFWYESGIEQTPAQLQIMYYIDQQRWIPRRSAFLRPPNMGKENELGRWNSICSNCHSTHPRTRPDANQSSWETRVSDFGITCEACHGPGESHVAFHRADPDAVAGSEETGEKAAVDPIVNPKELPTNLKSDICGQCHGMMMVSIDNAADQEKYFAHGREFRPGDRLEDAHFLRVVRASKEHRDSETFRKFDAHPGVMIGHFWPDGEMRVTGRDYSSMIESKCFQKGELACLSCHTMHQQDKSLQTEWKDDQLQPNMRGDAACLQCHPKYKDLGTEHTHHAVDSEGSRCMNCHMPHTIYGILKTSRTHTISSPSVATSVETGRPNACNLCHLDHTLAQTADYLATWYGHDKPKLTTEQKTTAASILQFLTGDAAQRVLQVNAFAWPPAREASGTDWMPIFLLLGMEDQYDAIRLMSQRAYKSLPDSTPLDYDFLDSPEERAEVFGDEYQKLIKQRRPPNEALLINKQGYLDQTRFEKLMNQRNHRPVYLQE